MSETAAILLDLLRLERAAKTEHCKTLLQARKFKLRPTLVEKLLAEDAQNGGGRNETAYDPGAIKDQNDVEATGQNDNQNDCDSGADADNDDDNDNDAPTLPAQSSEVSEKASSSSSIASSSLKESTTDSQVENLEEALDATVVENALIDFYQALNIAKTKVDIQRSVPHMAGKIESRRLAFTTLKKRYGADDAQGVALGKLHKALFPGESNDTNTVIKSTSTIQAAPRSEKNKVEITNKDANLIFTNITSFAWMQSAKFVSIHVDWPDIYNLPRNQVKVNFGERDVCLKIYDRSPSEATVKERHQWKIINLCHPIDTQKSKVIRKADKLVLKLKKQSIGQEWSALDDTKDRKEKERQRRIRSGDLKGASTQQLLADMYKNASDEDRKGLIKAAQAGNSKRMSGQ